MKLDLKLWLIIGLVVLVIILILTRPNHEPADNSIYHREINSQNIQIKTLEAHNRALLDSIKSDSLEDVKEKEAFTARLNVLNKRIVITRPIIMHQVDTLPQVKAFIADQDSVIMLQSVRIAGLEFLQMKLELNTQAIYANFEESLKLERQKFALAEKQIVDLEKQNRKERRKGKLKSILLPVAAGLGLILGVAL